MSAFLRRVILGLLVVFAAPAAADELRGTGDLGIVIERATGSVVGGISPLAPRRPLPVVVDDGAVGHPTILVSAGRRGLQLELAPADLVRLASATVAPVSRS